MNRREWVLYGQKELEEAQIENASGDAWYLFSECFHISREDYLFGMIDEINDNNLDGFLHACSFTSSKKFVGFCQHLHTLTFVISCFINSFFILSQFI